MLLFILRRLALTIPLALAVATLVFVAIETAPGDPTTVWFGDRPVPPEVRENLRTGLALDGPPHQRYLSWLGSVFLRGDLGWSHSRSRPVSQALAEAFPATLVLASAALLLHLLVGIFVGSLAASRPGHWSDRWLTALGLLLYAMPTFWLGLMAILTLSYAIPLFPASSMQGVGMQDASLVARLLDRLWHLALPAAVLGLASSAATARFVRAGLIDSMGQGFVRAARARGLRPRRILWGHALRNSLIPIINLTGLSLPVLLSGSLVTEFVFAWPGLGRLTYDAIRADDAPVVLASTMLATALVVVGNLLADLAMAAVDPRIRLGARSARG